MFINTILAILSLLVTQVIGADDLSSTSSPSYPVKQIYQFPNGTNIENLVIRSDGRVLLTSSGSPQLWLINPANNKTATIIKTFPDVNSLQGMVLLDDDTFAVLAGNHSTAPDYYGDKCSWAVWLTKLSNVSDAGANVAIEKLVELPEATLPDGFAGANGKAMDTVINQGKTNILVTGDALGGTFYSINLANRTSTMISKGPLFTGTNTTVGAGADEIGINGLKYANGTAFWDDSSRQVLAALRVDPTTGAAIGSPYVVQSFDTFIDDFQILPGGRGFLIAAEGEGILYASPHTNTSTVVANISGANAPVWGQTPFDRCILYVSYQGLEYSGLVNVNMTGSGYLPGC